MKKYFLRTFAAIALTLCISSCGNSPQEEQTVQTSQTEQTISETAAITTTSEILETETTAKITEKVQTETVQDKDDEFVVLKEQQILEPDGSIWYSSDVLRQYPHLTTLVDYILTDLQDEPSFIPSSMPENIIAIRLTDFNNDGNTDAFVSTASMGINYCMIDNINAPKLVYNFFAFDAADFLCDTKTGRLVIKYESHYGHFTNATSETNFIFAGDEITEINHVHFEGTSGPEEFYIVDENGEKTVCSEADITASIAEIEKNLQPFKGDTEVFRITVKDSETSIEKISD